MSRSTADVARINVYQNENSGNPVFQRVPSSSTRILDYIDASRESPRTAFRRLVTNLAQQCSGETQQLSLARRHRRTTFPHGSIKASRKRFYELFQVRLDMYVSLTDCGMNVVGHACSRATQISASFDTPVGSMFSRMVPSKRSGLCGTIEIPERTRK